MYKLETINAIVFELSSHCNSKCPQCPRFDMYGEVHHDLDLNHLPINLIKKLPLEKLTNLEKIIFQGNFGDPLMHPEIDNIIDFFTKQTIHINTNASLRTLSWWEKLGKKNNVSVTFCIDGLEDTHHLYRRNTSYRKILENAEIFIKSGGSATWQYIVFKHNEHQIIEAKKLSKKLGFKNFEIMHSSRFDNDNKWKVYENKKPVYDLEKSSNQITLREHVGENAGQKYWKKLYRDKGEIVCKWSKKKKLYIHSEGSVFPCCMLGGVMTGRHIEKTLLEKIIKSFKKINLNENTFEEIIFSEIFTKSLPRSFNNDPFTHPICIDYCNQRSGKYVNENLNSVNI